MKANRSRLLPRFLALAILLSSLALLAQNAASPFYDFHAESPGTIHKVTVSDLPAPLATKSAAAFPVPYPRPTGALPKVLPGFKVELYATGLDEPRELRTAPNGDVSRTGIAFTWRRVRPAASLSPVPVNRAKNAG